jgi:hypothetical protein
MDSEHVKGSEVFQDAANVEFTSYRVPTYLIRY